MRTAFVFAGGGSLGAVEVGMLRLLTRRGYLVAQTALRRLLERHLTVRQLEDTVLPCHVITTDLLGGTEVRLNTGPAVDALLASTAIPGIFQPVCRAGRHLVDGGVTSNTPIATAIELGAARVIVLPTGIACALAGPPRGMVAVALHALTLVIARQLVSDVERLRDRAEMVVVPPLCPLDVSSYDFSRGGELIGRAADSTARWLDGGGLRNLSIPGPLKLHHH